MQSSQEKNPGNHDPSMNSRISVFLFITFFLLLSGCINLQPVADNSNYHLLDHSSVLKTEPMALPSETPHIYFSRIDLPTYLDNKKLAIRKSPTEIQFSEIHRWVEPVEDSLSRALASNIQESLPEDWTVSNYPGRRTSSLGYEVYLKITRLEGVSGKEAILEGLLQVYQSNPETRLRKHGQFRLSQPWDGKDAAELPQLFSNMTRNLGEIILVAIRETVIGTESGN
jgi:uncharacterized lipoprotein YmbA